MATFDVTVEVAPDWPALVDDSLWVLTPDGPAPAVVRLDPATGAEQARVPLPGGFCEGIAAGFDSIWACTPDGLARIDPATNSIVALVAFETPEVYGRPAVTHDAVWALGGDVVPTDLVRIDPATNAVTATYPLGHTVARLAEGLGYLWATATRDGLLLRIDPASGEVTTAASELVDPWVVATGASRVWVGLQGVGTDEDPDPSTPDLFRYDPVTEAGDFQDYDLRPESIGDIAVTDDIAWLQAIGPFLLRLDPQSAAVESIVTSDLGTGALVLSDDALWLTVWRENAVIRIDR
jgi:streptogramin lyase